MVTPILFSFLVLKTVGIVDGVMKSGLWVVLVKVDVDGVGVCCGR